MLAALEKLAKAGIDLYSTDTTGQKNIVNYIENNQIILPPDLTKEQILRYISRISPR